MKDDAFNKMAPGHLEQIPEGVKAFVPDPLPPPSFDFSGCAELLEGAAGALYGLNRLVGSITSGDMLVQSFLRREAIRSSAIEGTRTQYGEMLLFELNETDEPTLNVDDAKQVWNNLAAFKHAWNLLDSIPVTERLLRETHGVLFDDANRLTKRPGEYRTTSTFIGRQLETMQQSFEAARFVPPPARHVGQAMRDLENFINLPENNAHLPRYQAALLHYQFETIHPFADGNGRIGRLAIALLLKLRGKLSMPVLCLSAYMDEHRDEYTDRMLGVSQRGEWVEWVRFFLRGVKEQAEEDVERCQRLMALRQSYLENLVHEKRIPFGVIDALFRMPAVTIPSVGKLMGTTYAPARRVCKRASSTRCAERSYWEEDKPRLFRTTNNRLGREAVAKSPNSGFGHDVI